ncbi:ralBP1-associated Eps domain-containing protein 2-like [Paramacrobiotus metropolitanus]|uniref:ralBP1-associated Eps domain-containing protein 2-like n=1 Tax=Paramacrobiotus metropolitanus TaxID=2943436 RepID=UPI0024465850|nr:ralBP1-associated Eps domain-containing protein 2-like [Paramacrobiotus metropolitanus]
MSSSGSASASLNLTPQLSSAAGSSTASPGYKPPVAGRQMAAIHNANGSFPTQPLMAAAAAHNDHPHYPAPALGPVAASSVEPRAAGSAFPISSGAQAPYAMPSSQTRVTSSSAVPHPDGSFTSSITMIPSTSGVGPHDKDSSSFRGTEPAVMESSQEHAEESDAKSHSDSEESSSDEKDSEADEHDVGETQSAISKVSNRSSPSVLSATIHQWPGYEEESHGLLDNNEEVSEDSENEDPEDPWRIQPEQRAWYLSLFLRLQPDVRGYVEGKDARVFFENSQLPLQDLGEIWNISDVDRDGRLTLSEFCYAMHLSVARRHGMSLPPHLPVSLRASTKLVVKASQQSAPSSIPAGDNLHQPEWTKFSESPRNHNRGPVQFRASLDTDKNLPHPVAVKPSPRSTLTTSNTKAAVRDARSFSAGTVAMPNSLSLMAPTSAANSIVTSGTVQAQPAATNSVIAPPPPPRSWHSRSASLDLQGQPQPNSAAKHSPGGLLHQTSLVTGGNPPPQLPPRSSPILSRRLDSATSESENESRHPASHVPPVDVKPEKPPRVIKTPAKNVSFAPAWNGANLTHDSVNIGLDFAVAPNWEFAAANIPTVADVERMSGAEVVELVQRMKIAIEGLTAQNADLQHQLTDVVLKKRTAEAQLAADRKLQ